VETISENAEEPTPAPKRSANYPLAFKRQLAQRACGENVSVAQLALEHGLNTNMVFKWRRRRNYLFAGAHSAAAIYSLIGTAKLNGVDLEAWLRHARATIADHPVNRVMFLPWRCAGQLAAS
jgi:transposase-like protein